MTTTRTSYLTTQIAQHLAQRDPAEFTQERLDWLLKVLGEVTGALTAGDFMAMALECPDFAGGTVFTTTDIAHALFDEDCDVSSPPEHAVARVTENQRLQAIDTIESFIFNGAYNWTEALRD